MASQLHFNVMGNNFNMGYEQFNMGTVIIMLSIYSSDAIALIMLTTISRHNIRAYPTTSLIPLLFVLFQCKSEYHTRHSHTNVHYNNNMHNIMIHTQLFSSGW